MKTTTADLAKISKKIRKHIISMSYKSKTAEIGSALCIADIMAVLYFDILSINPKKPNDPSRDRFILSKGHGSAALYATLAERGYFSTKELEKYRIDGGRFHGHPCRDAGPGIEVSTGSLGHGLSMAAGMGLAFKKDGGKQKVYTVIGDGECNEGSIWEAAMFIATHKLTNLVTIVDDNSFQGFGKTPEVHTMDIAQKFAAFGFEVVKVDGHNHEELRKALMTPVKNKPRVVIAKTIAGKGLPKIENTLLAHYYIPDEETYKSIMLEYQKDEK